LGKRSSMTRRSPAFLQGIICKSCGKTAPRTGPTQKYCVRCSETADLRRKEHWFHKNGKRSYREARSRVAERGKEISDQTRSAMIDWHREIDLVWQARVAFPFHWAASKNHLFALRKIGHIALRDEARRYRSVLALRIKTAVRGMPIVQNKVWLDIFVQKPNHRGDAANFIDLICDAIKEAIGVDDRWFSIRRVDWEIVKNDPQIFICVGQENALEAQVCSSCGRILPRDAFHKHKGTKTGISRNCKNCSAARTRRSKNIIPQIKVEAAP
jgi:hypothetical protein